MGWKQWAEETRKDVSSRATCQSGLAQPWKNEGCVLYGSGLADLCWVSSSDCPRVLPSPPSGETYPSLDSDGSEWSGHRQRGQGCGSSEEVPDVD